MSETKRRRPQAKPRRKPEDGDVITMRAVSQIIPPDELWFMPGADVPLEDGGIAHRTLFVSPTGTGMVVAGADSVELRVNGYAPMRLTNATAAAVSHALRLALERHVTAHQDASEPVPSPAGES